MYRLTGGWQKKPATTAVATAPQEVDMEAYCMKCKAKRQMNNARQITMKNGRPATQGVCPSCGTKMFKIGKG